MRGLIKIFLSGLAVLAAVIVVLPFILDPRENAEDTARRPDVIAAFMQRSAKACGLSADAYSMSAGFLEEVVAQLRTRAIADINDRGVAVCPDLRLARQVQYGLSLPVIGVYYPVQNILTIDVFPEDGIDTLDFSTREHARQLLWRFYRDYGDDDFAQMMEGNSPVYGVLSGGRSRNVIFRPAMRMGLEFSRNDFLEETGYPDQ